MVSTTSGLTTFTIDVDELIEQATDFLGGQHQSGIDTVKARRTLNLILIELQNKNIPLNKLAFISQILTTGVATYNMPSTVSDILKCSINDSSGNYDVPIDRYGFEKYLAIPNKTQTGRPVLFMTDRDDNIVTVTFWEIPASGQTYTAKLLVVQRVEDVNASYQQVDLPYRYLPLLTKWLRYELCVGRKDVDEATKSRFKSEFDTCYTSTVEEDRERTDFRVRPGGVSGR